MIIQAVGLLDDLDKELNNFAMRLKYCLICTINSINFQY